MSTQQDIYAAGSKNRLPMLNKDNYVPWSSRLLRYAKSKPNGKLMMKTKLKENKSNEAYDQPFRLYSWVFLETSMLLLIVVKLLRYYLHATTTTHNNYIAQPSFNMNYMQQPMPNPEDVTDPTIAMNMTLVLMAKAFKLNYSTPTNNNQRISSNPHNRQIAQSGMNLGQDRQMQMVAGNGGNQFRQYAGQNVRNQNGYNAVHNPGVQNVRNQNGLIVVSGIANQNLNGNGNVIAARAEGNAIRNNGN
ncbi:hypothetical protein Tco_0619320 [Tanacetum coccineum]